MTAGDFLEKLGPVAGVYTHASHKRGWTFRLRGGKHFRDGRLFDHCVVWRHWCKWRGEHTLTLHATTTDSFPGVWRLLGPLELLAESIDWLGDEVPVNDI